MRYTNEQELPWPVLSAIENHRYSKGSADYSVTELLNPPRVRELKRRHYDEIEVDAADMVFALFGTVVHFILQLSIYYDIWDAVEQMILLKFEPGHGTKKKFTILVNGLWKALVAYFHTDQYIVERRLFYRDPVTQKMISGQIDLVKPDDIVTDYKMMSIWEGINGLKPEKIQQLNLYNLLAVYGKNEDGSAGLAIEPRQLQIVSLYRDWSKNKAAQALQRGDLGYPQKQVRVWKVAKWPVAEAADFLQQRIQIHMRAEAIEEDDDLPFCSEEERWQRPSTWAVMKKGRKSALRVLNSHNDAEDWMVTQQKGEYIEERRGQAIRCENYCDAAPFCNQWQEIKDA